MKVALVGRGRTGAKVAELHSQTVCFDEHHKPTVEGLQACDVIISFLPGSIFTEYIDMFVASQRPAAIGSTGFEWPASIVQTLKAQKIKWVNAHNFSLGMNLVKAMIEIIGRADKLYSDPQFSIHDIHHVHKLDSPSGTALSWQEWLGHQADITAERTGDVVGYHHLELETPVEKIKLVHEARDRAIFAQGALWTADKLLHDESLEYGLTHFSQLVKKHINI